MANLAEFLTSSHCIYMSYINVIIFKLSDFYPPIKDKYITTLLDNIRKDILTEPGRTIEETPKIIMV